MYMPYKRTHFKLTQKPSIPHSTSASAYIMEFEEKKCQLLMGIFIFFPPKITAAFSFWRQHPTWGQNLDKAEEIMAPNHVSHCRPQPACSFINDLKGLIPSYKNTRAVGMHLMLLWLVTGRSELQMRRFCYCIMATAVLLFPTTVNPNHMHCHLVGQCPQHLVLCISWYSSDLSMNTMPRHIREALLLWKNEKFCPKFMFIQQCTVSEWTRVLGITIFEFTHICCLKPCTHSPFNA